jgi:hypothetical protein
MQEHDEDLERYLRTFQPRAVRPLVVRSQPQSQWLRRLAVAAVAVLAGGVSLWYAQRHIAKPPGQVTAQAVRSLVVPSQTHLNSPALTNLALDDSEAFEALLARESGSVLPRMQDEHSALRVLAKE